MNPIRFSALTALFGGLLFISPVFGHAPGFSVAEITLSNEGFLARITFARRDMEVLVPMDTDHDGVISAAEYTLAHPRLVNLRDRLLTVNIDGRRILPQSVDIELDKSDALNFRLNYATVARAALVVESMLIADLRRGHRQYLVVRDPEESLLTETMLTANKAQILIRPGSMGLSRALFSYIAEGVWHIFIGLDHILFLLTLMLPAVLVYERRRWQSVDELRPAVIEVLKTVSAFSLAHSITLSLAVLEFVSLPQRWVEAAIALSVLVVALNNLKPIIPGSRWWLAFIFGLVHGFGFSNVLMDLGFVSKTLIVSLVGFNLGVELGQVAIVLAMFPLAYVLRDTRLYQGWVFKGGSLVAASMACVWLVERVFGYELDLRIGMPLSI